MNHAASLLIGFTLCAAAPASEPRFPQPPPAPVEGGAFAQMVRAADFVEPGIVAAADWGPGDPPFRLPADFESVAAVALVADRLVADFPETFARLAGSLAPRTRLLATVADDAATAPVRSALRQARVPGDRAGLLRVATDTIWIRDFGGVFVYNRQGNRLALDFDYRRRSGRKNRNRDDDAARQIARVLRIPVQQIAMTLEGGHLLSNGRGLLLTTTAAVNANIARGYPSEAVTDYFAQAFGCRTVVLLEPLHREPTQHVDTFVCFTDPQTVVIGDYAEELDPINAEVLDRNARLLANVRTRDGPLRVVRVPMPPNDDNRWRTYTNVVFTQPGLLVPSYRRADRVEQNAVLAVFRRLLPAWQVESIDVTDLVARDGALRCVTLQVPKP